MRASLVFCSADDDDAEIWERGESLEKRPPPPPPRRPSRGRAARTEKREGEGKRE